ncbi:MAG: hypothetical protein ACREXW_17550 [Gammaproteobacteria bacterium]
MNSAPLPLEAGGQADRAVSGLAETVGHVHAAPPTFQELAGARLATLVFGVICSLAVAFLVAWWFTRPSSLAEVQTVFGSGGSGKEVLEALQALRSAHFGELRELFQVVAAITPCGYDASTWWTGCRSTRS